MGLFTIFDVIGIVAFVIGGFIIAREARLDILGVFIIASISALGGGVIRDIIANKKPFIFTNYYPLIVVVSTILLLILFKKYISKNHNNNIFYIISDALGLVSFTITGALVGISSGFNFFGIVALGMITAVGGGVIRDLLLNQIPYILETDFYASVAFIVSIIMYILYFFNMLDINNLLVLTLFGVLLRLVAVYFRWNLPKIDKISKL